MGTKTVAQLTAVISANNTKFKKGISGAKKSTGSFQKSIKSIGPAIIAAFSVGAIKNFSKQSLELLDKQAKAEKSLITALDGRLVAQNRLLNQAKELQKTTLFGDEETIQAQAIIAAFTDEADEIEKLIPLVQDFATVKQMSLSSSAELIAKTFASSTNALSRYGIQVEGTAGSAERLNDIMTSLTEAFAGQAEAAASVDKVFTQLKNTYGDFQETLAAFTTQTGRYGPLAVLKEDLENVASFLEKKTNPQLKKAQKNALDFMDALKDKQPDEQLESINTRLAALNRSLDLQRNYYKVYDKIAGESKKKQKKLYEDSRDAALENAKVLYETIQILESELIGIQNSIDGISIGDKPVDKLKAVNAEVLTLDAGLKLIQKDLPYVRKEFDFLDTTLEDLAFSLDDLDEEFIEIDFPIQDLKKTIDLSDQLAVSFARIGSEFASSLGEVAAGSQTFAEALSDISIQIASALGDILILAGLSTSPVGVPLVLAGLGLKGFSSFAGSAKSQAYDGGYTRIRDRFGQDSSQSNFTIRGNDLVTAYNDNTTLNQRLY